LPVQSLFQLLVIVATCSNAAAGSAQEWPRFHVGGAVGMARWSVDMAEGQAPPPPAPVVVWKNPAEPGTGWKLVAGFRPARVVGMEIEYVDFDDGDATVHGGRTFGGGQVATQYEQTNHLSAGFEASVLSALLFVPEHNPSLDVYGKLGAAKLDESLVTSVITIPCTPISQCRTTVTYDVGQSDVRPYVGIGARMTTWRALAVRVEYESIDRDTGDNLQMLSLGVTWER
jgi:hypothetical protein